MLDKPICIIVGAGASVDFGLPTGAELLRQITLDVNRFRDRIADLEERRISSLAWQDELIKRGIDDIEKTLCTYFVLAESERRLPVTINEVAQLFLRSSCHSVDDFALEHPTLSRLVKSLTAIKLAQAIFETRDRSLLVQSNRFYLRDLSFAYSPGSPPKLNWMHTLVQTVRNRARALAANSNSPASSRIHMVSFNYDGLVEDVVRRVWAQFEENLGAVDAYFDFIHPHGRFDFSTSSTFVASAASQFEKNIRYAWEPHNDDVLSRTASAVLNSDQIFAFGFNFADSNVTTLRLRERAQKGSVFVQNFDNNAGLNRRLSLLGIPEHNIRSGSIPKLIADGFLGYTPN